jgi:hypothetical protein
MVDKPDFDRLGDLLPEASEAAAEGAGRGAGTPGGPAASNGSGSFARVSQPSAEDPRPGARHAPGLPASELNQRLAAVWADAVGPEVAGNAKPVQLRNGRLVVTTSSSPWAQTLQLMSEMVIARVNERLGERVVERVVFRHAGWEDFSAADELTGRGKRMRGPALRPARATSGATEPSTAAEPLRVEPPDEPAGFSEEEKQALADIELLPLPASAKAAIRDAMKAGFVRARQDFGRL